jgi:hypothetical protein
MKQRALAAVLIVTITGSAVLSGERAVGSVSQPVVAAPQAPAAPRELVATKIANAKQKVKKSMAAVTSRFANLRPQPRKSQWDQAEEFLSQKTTNEEIFDEEMSNRMRAQYQGAVLPFENAVNNPTRRASSWEIQRYEQSRKDLANWTMKEVGRAQLKEFIQRSRKNSAAISAVAATATGTTFESGAPSNLTAEEKIARAHRIDQVQMVEQEEEVIPTRLRAKLNLLKAQGNFTFTNPIVTTSIEARAGSGEKLAVELNRDFRSIEMNSKVRYAVDQSHVRFNVNKKITKEVSVDLNSERWTGSKRGASGEKSNGSAKVLYSVSF